MNLISIKYNKFIKRQDINGNYLDTECAGIEYNSFTNYNNITMNENDLLCLNKLKSDKKDDYLLLFYKFLEVYIVEILKNLFKEHPRAYLVTVEINNYAYLDSNDNLLEFSLNGNISYKDRYNNEKVSLKDFTFINSK